MPGRLKNRAGLSMAYIGAGKTICKLIITSQNMCPDSDSPESYWEWRRMSRLWRSLETIAGGCNIWATCARRVNQIERHSKKNAKNIKKSLVCLVNVHLILLEKWEDSLGVVNVGYRSSLGPERGYLCLTVDTHGLSWSFLRFIVGVLSDSSVLPVYKARLLLESPFCHFPNVGTSYSFCLNTLICKMKMIKSYLSQRVLWRFDDTEINVNPGGIVFLRISDSEYNSTCTTGKTKGV